MLMIVKLVKVKLDVRDAGGLGELQTQTMIVVVMWMEIKLLVELLLMQYLIMKKLVKQQKKQ